jgi:hypothetical protein
MLLCKISREQVLEAVGNWWHDGLRARNLNSKAKIIECRLQYVPFWKVGASVAGRIEGKVYESEPGGNGGAFFPETKHVAKAYVWTRVAADAREIGIEYLRNLKGTSKPYDGSCGIASEVKLSDEDALAIAIGVIEDKAVKSACLDRVTSKQIKTMILDYALIYYPLWVIKYSYAEHVFPITVDGVTGNILAGRVPGDTLKRLIAMGAGAVVCVGGIALSAWIFHNVFWYAAVVIVILTLAICLAFGLEMFAYSFYGSVMDTGEFTHGYRPLYSTKIGRYIAGFAGFAIGLAFMFLGMYGNASVNHIQGADILGVLGVIFGCLSLGYANHYPNGSDNLSEL